MTVACLRDGVGLYVEQSGTQFQRSPANQIWDEELEAVGAGVLELPATDNRSCCDNPQKMTALFDQAGFVSVEVWTESIEHRWRPQAHFEYQVRSSSRLRLQSLSADDREIRDRLYGANDEQYLYRGDVVIATAKAGLSTKGGGE